MQADLHRGAQSKWRRGQKKKEAWVGEEKRKREDHALTPAPTWDTREHRCPVR